MSCIIGNGVAICGNFVKPTKRKPKNWIERGYKIIVPFTFKWRANLGKVVCDCKYIHEHYQPWYGFTWLHSEECATMKHLKKYPQMQNFFWEYDPKVIACSE